jgi:hypothetical protein
MTEEQQSQPDHSEYGEITFAGFVLSLAHTAAVHFGDVPDPISGAASEPNLVAAQQMIDILDLLEQKTRGNLTAEERQLLEQLLYELRLRFVEVRARGAAPQTPPSGSRTPSGIIIP